MAATENEELRKAYERNSSRAEWLARLILAGLLVEIIAVFVLGKPLVEALFSVGATALIAIGVWGELHFEKRAREAGDGIVAAANARAEEARAETERLKAEFAWRVLPRDMRLVLSARLSQSSGAVKFVHIQNDAESHHFLMEFARAFRSAGWRVKIASCTYAGATTFGVRVSEGESANFVAVALLLAGVEITRGPLPRPIMETMAIDGIAPNTAEIYVGPKPMPFADE